MAPIRGFLELPFDVLVASEVLGCSIPATVEGNSCSLTFPVQVADDRGLAPPSGFEEFAIVSDRRVPWGLPPRILGRMHGVSAIAVEAEESANAEQLARGFGPWFVKARSWINAACRLPNAFYTNDRQTPGVRLFHDGKQCAGWGGGAPINAIPVARGASRVEVEAAFAHASRGVSPPLAHLLLLDALSALVLMDQRRAIIDATSASEVALATFLRGHLQRISGPDAEIIQLIIKQANGVAGLYQLCKTLGLGCELSQKAIGAKLGERRNKVVHAGASMSYADAKEVVDLARTIVETAIPLELQ
jgi:hypothetical protein